MRLLDALEGSRTLITDRRHVTTFEAAQISDDVRTPIAVADHADANQYAPSPEKTACGVRRRILRSSQSDHVVAYLRSRRTMSSNGIRLRPFTCQSPVIPGCTSSKRRRCQMSYASSS